MALLSPRARLTAATLVVLGVFAALFWLWYDPPPVMVGPQQYTTSDVEIGAFIWLDEVVYSFTETQAVVVPAGKTSPKVLVILAQPQPDVTLGRGVEIRVHGIARSPHRITNAKLILKDPSKYALAGD